MTSLRMLRRWKLCLIGTTVLQAVVIISTSGLSCGPEVACYPPSVQLANLSFPVRQLNVSSTCGSDNSTAYCSISLETIKTCLADSPFLCSGQHTADHMLDYTLSSGIRNPDVTTYWQSDNSIASSGARPTTQYVEVRLRDDYAITNTEFLGERIKFALWHEPSVCRLSGLLDCLNDNGTEPDLSRSSLYF